MANSDKNILITPSVGLSTNPTIRFNGANNTPTTLRVLDDGTISFEGTAGQLFSISDGLTGSIFSVNDISGIPSIEVLDTGLIKINQYNGSTVFGASAAIQNSSSVNSKVSISTGSASTPGLIIKAVSSQTANLQEWQNSVGGVDTAVTSTGRLSVRTTLADAGLNVGTPSAATVGAIIRGVTSQTADLQQWQNSSGTIISRIYSDGSAGLYGLYVFTGGASITGNYGNTDTLQVTINGAARRGILVKGAASQTANLQEWQNSSGTVLARVTNSGVIGTSVGVYSPIYQGNNGVGGAITFANDTAITITPQSASVQSLIVKGAASQTANLQEWQDSSGASKAYLSINGHFVAQRVYAPDSLYVVSTGGPGTVNIETYANNGIGVIIKGKSSQTADLQQWQNSTGTVLAGVNAAGQIYAGTTASINGSTTTAITSAAFTSATVAVFTYGGTSLVQAGQRVTVAGVTGGTYNGTWTVTAVTSTTFTVLGSGFTDVAGTGGTFTLSAVGSFVASTAAITPIVVRGAASQTANLQEWQNSAGLALARIKSSGNTVLLAALTVNQSNTLEVGDNAGIGSFEVKGTSFLTPRAATGVGLIVRGFASQTANLQEWQNSSGTVLAKVNSYGGAEFVDLKINTTSSLGSLGIVTGTTTQKGIVVRGIASQTANLQEWQDSAGSVLSSITYFGGARLYDLGIKGGPEGIGWAYFGNENTSTKNVVVRAFASQTANLTEWQDSAGTALATVSSSGSFTVNNLGVGGTLGATVRFIVTSSGAGNVVSMFRGAASQTANLQEWQNSSATVLASISSAGKLTSAVDASINGVTIGLGGGNVSNNTASGVSALLSNTTGGANTATGSGALYSNTTGVNNTASGVDSLRFNTTGNYNTATGSGALYSSTTGVQNTASGVDSLRFNTTGNYNTASGVSALLSNTTGNYNTASGVNSLNFNTTGSNNTIIGFQAGYSNVTGNASVFLGYQAGYNETGSNKLYIANSNTATPLIGGDFSAKTLTFAGNATVVSQAAATQGLIIKGATSQTGNLQEWQDSTGTVVASVTPTGNISTNRYISNQASNAPYIDIYGSALTVISRVASYVGFIVKGVASQTANLQEWQNSSGTVLAYTRNDGMIAAQEVRTINNHVMLREENSGGYVNLVKATATNNNPGANQAKLYLRDGTNAGTLKLVVRAGAAGAETTILDNIPQS